MIAMEEFERDTSPDTVKKDCPCSKCGTSPSYWFKDSWWCENCLNPDYTPTYERNVSITTSPAQLMIEAVGVETVIPAKVNRHTSHSKLTQQIRTNESDWLNRS